MGRHSLSALIKPLMLGKDWRDGRKLYPNSTCVSLAFFFFFSPQCSLLQQQAAGSIRDYVESAKTTEGCFLPFFFGMHEFLALAENLKS